MKSANPTAARSVTTWHLLVIACLISAIIGTLTALTYQALLLPPPLRLATVDLSVVVSEQLRRIRDMEPVQADAVGRRWGETLDRSIQAIADEHGVVLLSRSQVVSGVPDLTDELRWRLAHDTQP